MSKEQKRFRLSSVDLSKSLDEARYLRQLDKQQKRLQMVQHAYLRSQHSAVIVFEGWDAAGKGGAIRRMAAVLDPRNFKVWPIAAPRNYYKERHYLARFWERLPPNGAISVFDRSWYGRVLVERVEQLAAPKDWQRAYNEINEFEAMLDADGTRLVKIFLHVSAEEQRRRFEARLRDPMKRWKLSVEDFRNLCLREDYTKAIEDMVSRTSTRVAPWHVIPGDNKKYARVACLKTIANRLSAGIDLSPPALSQEAEDAARRHLGVEPHELG